MDYIFIIIDFGILSISFRRERQEGEDFLQDLSKSPDPGKDREQPVLDATALQTEILKSLAKDRTIYQLRLLVFVIHQGESGSLPVPVVRAAVAVNPTVPERVTV